MIYVAVHMIYTNTERRLTAVAQTPMEAATEATSLLSYLRASGGEHYNFGAPSRGHVTFSHAPLPIPRGVPYASGDTGAKLLLAEWATKALCLNQGLNGIETSSTVTDDRDTWEMAKETAAKIRRRVEDTLRNEGPVAAISTGLYVADTHLPLSCPDLLKEIW